MNAGLEVRSVVHCYRRVELPLWPLRGVPAPVLRGVSLQVRAGECVGLVGGSGAGKSTLLRILLALEAPTAGSVFCSGRRVVPGTPGSLRWFRRTVQYVPQDPGASLNPRMSVAALLREPLRALRVQGNHRTHMLTALDQVALPHHYLERTPHELSGGQAQRVAIARALVSAPAFLIADEPVSGLDLPLRNHLLELLSGLNTALGLGILLVSHDISAIAKLSARTAVLADGRIVESGPTSQLLSHPGHPATQALIQAVPQLPVPGGTPTGRPA